MKGILLSILILIVLLFARSDSNALVIDKFKIDKYEYTNKTIDAEYQKSVVEEVYEELKDTWLKDVPVRIIYSEKGIKGIKGAVFESKGTYYILMADTSMNSFQIYQTFLHEVGHIVQRVNFNLKFFARFIGQKYNQKTTWKHRTSEKFAEYFKYWYIKENTDGYTYTHVRIYTSGGYDKDFDTLMWLWS